MFPSTRYADGIPAWFWALEMLLTRYSCLWLGFGLLASCAIGLIGGGSCFCFSCHSAIISDDENMDFRRLRNGGMFWAELLRPLEGGRSKESYAQGGHAACASREATMAAPLPK